jgi:hypothetical protein
MDEQRQVAGRPDPGAAKAETKGPAARRPSRQDPSGLTAVAAPRAGAEPSEPTETARPDGVEAPEVEATSGALVGHIQNVAAPLAGAIGSILEAANQALSSPEKATRRRLRRLARQPLANLYELHPEARSASPRELGMRFVPIEEVRGTAVAGPAQRGGDFLPLKPFRGENWMARWQRIREANRQLRTLPPVDLVKHQGEYWVVDGHNRVAAALYGNGVGLDAMVTELIPLDGGTSERPRHVLSVLGETANLRAAAQGRRPAIGVRRVPRPADEVVRVSSIGASPAHEAATAGPVVAAAPGTDAWPRAEPEPRASPAGQPRPASGPPTVLEEAD